ncbi:Glutamyl-tRNA(Gln) amidotransferase subunit A [Spirochaeta thermophila DSM 6578]|uniref:Glutamyl-tRNA(Gln) amidotransferase subunit A n=1 Tax=Winmispira thermophila (strain ATCC 700085 / DSM 6578 / Z-1203) TaxID=869211 RepID=G0GG44_WINT7|nr:amidase family protein [Spirochaeta thermophila]AEJ62520.1 Glutamyl-tRNA(Gln) amidotransferase subunit A [Spirochaeta thermophila DSM 6578]
MDLLDGGAKEETYLSKLRERNEEIGAFLSLDAARGKALSSGDGVLRGLPFGVKDNIAVEGFPLTCASRMLQDLVSPYTATAVSRLLEQGAVVVGKTNLDEFGMGSSCDMSALGRTNNPWDLSRAAGGSSGGSAAAVSAGMVPFALGSDTGGSVRQPAAFCGVYGLKPTYGVVSRFGLVAYASSLEVIGAVAMDLDLLETVFEVMRGEDERDHSSLDPEEDDCEVRRIAVLTGDLGLEAPVARAYERAQEVLKDLGFQLVEVVLPELEYAVPAYYTIATAEASANLARYTGIRYGHRPMWSENPQELMRKARSEGFGPEVKLRILLGTFVLRSGFQDRYYHKAQRVRTLIRRSLEQVFSSADVLLMPVFPTLPFPHGEGGLSSFQQKMADRFTTTANLAGVPALAVPVGREEGLPVGVQVMAPPFGEQRLFQVARAYRRVYTPEHPVAYPPLWS